MHACMHEEMNECATTHSTVSLPTLLQMNARDKQDVSQGSSSHIYNLCQHNLCYVQQGQAMRAVLASIASDHASNVIMCDP